MSGVIPEEDDYEQEMYDDVTVPPVPPIDEDIYEELPREMLTNKEALVTAVPKCYTTLAQVAQWLPRSKKALGSIPRRDLSVLSLSESVCVLPAFAWVPPTQPP